MPTGFTKFSTKRLFPWLFWQQRHQNAGHSPTSLSFPSQHKNTCYADVALESSEVVLCFGVVLVVAGLTVN